MVENTNEIVKVLVKSSKSDWDSYETSWDFKKHPFALRRKPMKEKLLELIYQTEEIEKEFHTIPGDPIGLKMIGDVEKIYHVAYESQGGVKQTL